MEGYALALVGRVPFCSAEEVAGVLRKPLEDVRTEVRSMKIAGMVEVGYGGGGSSERLYLTRRGIEELARRRNCTVERLVSEGFAVTNDWLKLALRRSPSIPVFYALSMAASEVQGYPCIWYWRRHGWLDGTIEVGPGLLMRVARIGKGVSRSSIRSRLGSMVETWRKAFINTALIVCCDKTTEAFVRSWLRAGARGIFVWTADERDVLDMDLDDVDVLAGPRRDRMLWRSFRGLVKSVRGYHGSEAESGLQIEQRARNTLLPERGLADRRFRKEVAAGRLGIAERAVLEVVSDWPLISGTQLARMTGYEMRSLEAPLASLRAEGFLNRVRIGRQNRLVLGAEGFRWLAWKDRVQVRDLQVELGLASDSGKGTLGKDDIVGKRLGELAKHERHTTELYEAVSLIAEGCRDRQDIELVELVPPHRSERWMRRGRRTYGVRPDASGVAKLPSGLVQPFMIEYERRATEPEKMEERVGPYKRYYDTLNRADAWRVSIGTMVIYGDTAAASRFVVHCRRNPYVARSMGGMPLPIFVSSVEEMRASGAAGACWKHANRLHKGSMTLAEACRVM